jgi:hypothetical protein
MKKILFALCLLFASSLLFSQNTQQFKLLLSSGIVTHTISANPWEAFTSDSAEAIDGKYYRHIRFAILPDLEKQQTLEALGVKLLYYVSAQTYFASISVTTPRTLDASYSIEGVYRIAAKEKMHLELSAALEQNNFPPFSINSNGLIGITFTYPSDLPHQVVIDQLAKYEITYQHANSHRITTWITAAEISAFVAHSFVCVAELKDDVATLDNNEGRTNHRNNWIAQDFSGGRMYNGAGVNVMLQDDGIIGPHIDYTGRLMQQYISFNGGDHGDHCAGIIMGGGNKDPLTRGMGWGANLFVYEAIPYQGFDSIYSHYNTNQIVISSTSYSDGCNAGYSTLAQTLDQQINDMPNLIHVFSAGNMGASDCGYGAGSDWGNITGGHKHSKNSIAVGNLDYIDVIASSSSRGPVHDGRMKPEVCAVGTNVYSTVDANAYDFKTGTSMSCPAVAGTLSEMYQAYKALNSNVNPPSGLMKAILMNTCDDLGNPGPDFIYGYGRVNGRKAILPIEQQLYVVGAVTNNASNVHTITIPANTGQVKILVYWHDYPAAVNASVALVNDINMQVVDPSMATFNPWVLDFTPNANNLNAVAIRGNDIRNNHEQVTIDNPIAGNYTITINGSNIPFGPQEYFLVWYFEPANELVMTYPNGGEGFAPGQSETIRWDAYGNTGTFDLEYSVDNGLVWTSISTGIPAAQRYFNWNVPNELSGECLVRVSRLATNDVSDANFSIIPVPANLVVDWSCPDSLQLSWNAVAGASAYDVFMLGNMYMDSIGNTTATSMVVHNLNNFTNSYWFSVRARGPQQAIGRRAIAIEKNPSIFCPGAFDASVTTITAPENAYLACINTSALPVSMQLYNPGLTTLTNIPVSFSVNGGPPVNEVFTGSLAPMSSASYTFTATASIQMAGNNTLEIWSDFLNDIDNSNDTSVLNIFYSTAIPVVPPLSENFESFQLCAITNDCEATSCNLINGFTNLANGLADDIDWRTFEGPSPSTQTGPDMDYAPGTATGNYLYLEASLCFNKTAILYTPCIDLTTFANPTLSFAYHMYGTGMGSLHVDIYSGGSWINDVFTQSGNQGNQWLDTNISLSPYSGQIIVIRFRGITGNAYTGDMAIDDIQIGNISSSEETHSGVVIDLYPNPTDGLFNLSLSNVNSEKVAIAIYDVSGRKVMHNDFGSVTGILAKQLDLSAYENGIYFLEVQIGDERNVMRLIKTD